MQWPDFAGACFTLHALIGHTLYQAIYLRRALLKSDNDFACQPSKALVGISEIYSREMSLCLRPRAASVRGDPNVFTETEYSRRGCGMHFVCK